MGFVLQPGSPGWERVLSAGTSDQVSFQNHITIALCLFASAGLSAQTATVAASASTYPASAGQLTLVVTMDYASVSAPVALGFSIDLPPGWALVGSSGANVPSVRPQPGDSGTLEFAYTSIPVARAVFSVVLSHPAGLSGNQVIKASGLYRTPLRTLSVPDLVLVSEAASPVITRQPSGGSVVQGQPFSLSVAASGGPSVSYQWSRNGVAIDGATSAVLNLGAVSASSAGSYGVVVSNAAGRVSSTAAVLSVTSEVVLPVVTTQPASQSVTAGSPVTLFVVAGGSAPLSYQWFKDGATLPGATDAALVFPGVFASSAGTYSVVVANAGGTYASAPAVLSVTAGVSAPSISAGPVSRSVETGSPVTFSVTASGSSPLSYQWRRNGIGISGATGSLLVLGSVASASAGNYDVVVSNAAGSASSAVAVLTVVAAALPVITAQPASQAVPAGGSATLSVTATGSAPLAYQWRRDGETIAGATGPSFLLSSVSAASAGSYSVLVSNSAGSISSRPAVVSVVPATGRTGAFLGNFSGDAGSFALWVRPDRTAVFLGFLKAGGRALLNRAAEIGADGSFQFPIEIFPAGGPATGVSGVISADGSVTGAIAGSGVAISAAARAAGASTAALAGYYASGEPNGSSVAHTILGAAGESYVLIVTDSGAEAGRGTAGSDGAVSISTGPSTVAGSVQGEGSTLILSARRDSGASVSFVGANDERRTSRERLINLSTRSDTTGAEGNALIVGFLIGGAAPKRVLVRAIGPSLAPFGVGGAMAAARLEVFRGQTSLAVSDAWGAGSGAPAVAAAAARLGAFTLEAASRDAAVLVELPPGAYTAVMTGPGQAGGVGLIEVYDADESPSAVQRIGNLASRGLAGRGDRTLTVGFVVGGTVPKRVLIRGSGPALAEFGVTGALRDPRLEIYRDGSLVGRNDNWDEVGAGVSIAAASAAVGAFPLRPGGRDAAIILNLFPGAYTAQLSGADDQAGTALVEVYELP